jgi:RNA polymerase sigma factor (sigma-70 family)
MTDRDDRWGELLRRANRGDGPAYAVFLSEAAPVIRRLVSVRAAAGVAVEVEDIVQEVLLAIHNKRHTWREAEPVTPWLYAIARYKTADAGRRRRGAAEVPVEDLADELPADIVEVTAGRDLARLLAGIDARAARIVREIGVEGASAAEVGGRLGMSEGAVRVAYHRALADLKRRVAEERT